MEVGYINNMPVSLRNPEPGEHSVPAIHVPGDSYNGSEERFDFEKVMMGPDELKSFFYMLIGANDLRIVSDEGKTGSVVDRFV